MLKNAHNLPQRTSLGTRPRPHRSLMGCEPDVASTLPDHPCARGPVGSHSPKASPVDQDGSPERKRTKLRRRLPHTWPWVNLMHPPPHIFSGQKSTRAKEKRAKRAKGQRGKGQRDKKAKGHVGKGQTARAKDKRAPGHQGIGAPSTATPGQHRGSKPGQIGAAQQQDTRAPGHQGTEGTRSLLPIVLCPVCGVQSSGHLVVRSSGRPVVRSSLVRSSGRPVVRCPVQYPVLSGVRLSCCPVVLLSGRPVSGRPVVRSSGVQVVRLSGCPVVRCPIVCPVVQLFGRPLVRSSGPLVRSSGRPVVGCPVVRLSWLCGFVLVVGCAGAVSGCFPVLFSSCLVVRLSSPVVSAACPLVRLFGCRLFGGPVSGRPVSGVWCPLFGCRVVQLSCCPVVRLSGCRVVRLSGCPVVRWCPVRENRAIVVGCPLVWSVWCVCSCVSSVLFV